MLAMYVSVYPCYVSLDSKWIDIHDVVFIHRDVTTEILANMCYVMTIVNGIDTVGIVH